MAKKKKKYVFTAARRAALKRAQAATRKKSKSPRKKSKSKKRKGKSMATAKKRTPAQKRALVKARKSWSGMSKKARAKAMPGGHNPGNPKSSRKKSRRRNPYSRQSITGMMMRGGIGVAGAIGGSYLADKVPVKDERLKAAIPLVMALGLGSTRFVQRSPELQAAVYGLLIVGGMSLTRQLLGDRFPMLAGHAGYNSKMRLPYDAETMALLGKTVDLAPKENVKMGEPYDLSGARGYRSPADL